ncbi:helix-turn-helix transcriptional regulator [Nocardia thailandica]|uniref:helix-turn-helix transcriptional regulator n=1 Tax=Nocardia thailandica TaxID=257275 RepID=UPI0002E58AAE|nr:helix-turn-helix domain-containing protein [Nocardia thailandica]
MPTNTRKTTNVTPAPAAATAVVAERLWTIDDLATYLGVSVETIYEWRKGKGGPPAIKIGKGLRWRRAAVEAWLQSLEEAA